MCIKGLKMLQCSICKSEVDFLQNHHIIPKSVGGTDEDSNIISICINCHRKIHTSNITSSPYLINKGFERVEYEDKVAKIWLTENKNLVIDKLNKLYKSNNTKYNLIASLLDNEMIPAYALMKYGQTGILNLKIKVTINEKQKR